MDNYLKGLNILSKYKQSSTYSEEGQKIIVVDKKHISNGDFTKLMRLGFVYNQGTGFIFTINHNIFRNINMKKRRGEIRKQNAKNKRNRKIKKV